MIKLRSILALAGFIAALSFLVACDSMTVSPSPTPPAPTVTALLVATVIPEITPEPTATAVPTATGSPEPTATPLPTAGPLPAGWQWYENMTLEPVDYRIAYPETWTAHADWGITGQPSNVIVHRTTFQSPETGSSMVIDIWKLSGRREGDLLDWVNANPDGAVFDSLDEPLTYNATVLGRPAVFHYHPARWGTGDFAVTLFVAGDHRYRLHFNSASLPVTEGEPEIYRTMLESLQIFGQPDGLVEIPTGWEAGAGLVIDTRPIETAAGEIVDLAAAPYVPFGGTEGIEGTFGEWQEEILPSRFTLVTDDGETYLIRIEAFRIHFRGEPIDYRFNGNEVQQPQPGERVWVAGRVIAPNEVLADGISVERGGQWQPWFIRTLLEMTPEAGYESELPTNAIISEAGNPDMWLRGPLQAMAGLLVDEVPPVLPAEWQAYADRTALAYGVVNADQHVEIKEAFVQDGPCEVTPAMTHCQTWVQILPETPSDN